MRREDNPCYKCVPPKRKVGCHSTCKEHKDYLDKFHAEQKAFNRARLELPEGTVGFLKSKSGLNVNHGITSEGVIDVGYTGSIRVKLYNNSDVDYEVKAGDKISQLVILPICTPTLELVDSLDETERGTGGFGSSER